MMKYRLIIILMVLLSMALLQVLAQDSVVTVTDICRVTEALADGNLQVADELLRELIANDFSDYGEIFASFSYLEFDGSTGYSASRSEAFNPANDMPDWTQAIDFTVFTDATTWGDDGDDNYYSIWVSDSYVDWQDGFTGNHYSWDSSDGLVMYDLGGDYDASETTPDCEGLLEADAEIEATEEADNG